MSVRIYPFELGSYRDNVAVYDVAMYRLRCGDREGARALLETLDKHIEETLEAKSCKWLLPAVKAQLQNLDREQPALTLDDTAVQVPAAQSRWERVMQWTHEALLSKAVVLAVYSIVMLSLYIVWRVLELGPVHASSILM